MLAFACAFTMFAGAAFTDQADIEHSDAVDMLNSLGVIGGYPDGSFHPEKTITRAEMAKMIFTIRNGGSTDASAYADVATTFTDIDGHWAAGYIKYCQVNGIISGKSSYIFDPEGEVTVVETAKMALVLMGYKADRANLTGAGWDSRVLSLATDNELLDKVAGSVTAPITRDEAAQLLYNTVNAECVVWSNDKETFIKDEVTVGGVATTRTVGTKYLDLIDEKGVLTSVNYDDNDDVYTTVVTGAKFIGGSISFDATSDNSALMGREVQVLYKIVKDEPVLFGMYATEKNKTVTTIYGDADISGTTATIDKTDYDITGVTTIATNGTVIRDTNYDDWDNYAYAEVTLVDNDSDKVYEYAVVNPFKVAQVTSVTTKKIYFDAAITDDASGVDVTSVDVDDLDAYEGLAEDDYVMLTEAAYSVSGNVVAVKAETVSGKVSGTKSDDSIQIDGAWYKKAATSVDVPNAGDELDYAVVANGYYFATEGATGSADKLALVLKVGSKDFDGDYSEVKLLLSDGTTKTTKAYVKDGTTKTAPVLRTLYTYTENADGYVLKVITDGTDIGMDAAVISGKDYNSITNKIDNKRVAVDAKVFVMYEASVDSLGAPVSYKGKLITGADVDKWADKTDYATTVAYTDGNVKVMVADVGVAALPNATDDYMYGVALSDPYLSQDADGNDIYVIDSFLTESGIVSISVKDDEYTAVTKNALVAYKMSGDEYVDFGTTPTGATAIVGAVTDVDGDYVTVKVDSNPTPVELKVDADDSTILGFDSDAGIEGSNTIREANKKDNVDYYANILVVYKTVAESDGSHIIWGAAVDAGNMLLDDSGNELTVDI